MLDILNRKKKDKKLVLHIGSHKTGTTSIQHSLFENSQALHDSGYTYFCKSYGEDRVVLPNLHSYLFFDHNEGLVPGGMKIRGLEELKKKLADIPSDVIVSSENFSFVFDRLQIERLKLVLDSVFDEIVVVCYLRRQDKHIISHHQEGSKLKRKAEYDLFGHSTSAIPEYCDRHSLYLDYDSRIGMWCDVFGTSNVVVKIYERDLLVNNDVVDDFFELLGIKVFEKFSDKNVSLTSMQAKLGHIINSMGELSNKRDLYNLMLDFEGLDRKMKPARKKALEYYENYKLTNVNLNRRLGISGQDFLFDCEFNDYPDNSEDEWNEVYSNEVFKSIFLKLDSILDHVDSVRDAAILLENDNPELSMSLMRLAKKLRSNGPLITRKLSEYSQKAQDS